MFREILLICLVACSTLGSQLLVKYAVTQVGNRSPGLAGFEWLITVVTSWPLILAVIVQGMGFLVWVFVMSRMKLGVAFAISGSFFYILMALSGWYLYGERLGPVQWIGLVMISAGVFMLTMR